MSKIAVYYNEKKKLLSVNDNGNISFDSLKKHFPNAEGLTYKNEKDHMHDLAISHGEIIIDSKIKKYFVQIREAVSDRNGAIENITAVGAPVNGHNEKTKEDTKNSTEKPNPGSKSTKSREKHLKTLRVGWLHKSLTAKRYSKMKRPTGGVIRLKLDESQVYSAAEVRRLAIVKFALDESEYQVELGLFNGQPLKNFTRAEGDVCDDVWDYCRAYGRPLYQLNLFLLTKPRRPADNVRLLYHYTRVSKYSNETLYTECDKIQLHSYLLEQQFGDGPAIEQFDPLDHGYLISRIEKDGRVMLQINIEDDSKTDNGTVKCFQYPAVDVQPEPHSIVHEPHELQGYCNATMGIGMIVSCTDACRPIFTWLRDNQVYRSAEYLYWLDGVVDGEKHVWSCTVTCRMSEKELKSKEIEITD